jgi:hypothetical protein
MVLHVLIFEGVVIAPNGEILYGDIELVLKCLIKRLHTVVRIQPFDDLLFVNLYLLNIGLAVTNIAVREIHLTEQ